MKYILILISLTIGLNVFGQCPVTSPNSTLSATDAGSPPCDPNIYEYQGDVSNSGSCFQFSGTSCGIAYYGNTYSLTCGFCVTFDMTLSTLTADGLAFTIADFSAAYNDNPCEKFLGCNLGGNIGYNEFNNAADNLGGGSGNGGALTVEFDVYDNIADGDADEPSLGAGYCPHVAVVEDGDNGSFEDFSCVADLNDGSLKQIEICWDPTGPTFSVDIDGTNYINMSTDIVSSYFPSGNTDVHFAFTSGYNPSFLGTNTACNWDVIEYPSLGVALKNFEVNVVEKEIEITWETLREENAKSYIIEKSTDGKNFFKLAEIDASNELSGSDYIYTDKKPVAGVSYYRLKQVDQDNKTEYLGIRQIAYFNDLNVFYDNQEIMLFGYKKEVKYLKVYDMGGSLIYASQNIGDQQYKVGNLNKGIYIVELESNNSTIVKKIVVK